jgi:hypothetical protein
MTELCVYISGMCYIMTLSMLKYVSVRIFVTQSVSYING